MFKARMLCWFLVLQVIVVTDSLKSLLSSNGNPDKCTQDRCTYGRIEAGFKLRPYSNWATANPELFELKAIQSDILNRYQILATFKSHIVRIGLVLRYVETGRPWIVGFQDGYRLDAMFDGIAGFVQLPDGEVLISDQANRCIRKLNRYTQSVSTFRCDNKNLTGYVPWETFNQPSTMQYDDVTNTVYLLDTKDGRSVIVGLKLDRNISFIARPTPLKLLLINDFLFDPYTKSFVTIEDNLVANFSGSLPPQVVDIGERNVAIASFDEIFVLVSINRNIIFYDSRYHEVLLKTADLSFNESSWFLLTHSTTAAIIDGYLYVGSSVLDSDFTTTIYRVPFTTIKDSSLTTTGIEYQNKSEHKNDRDEPIRPADIIFSCTGVAALLLGLGGLVKCIHLYRTKIKESTRGQRGRNPAVWVAPMNSTLTPSKDVPPPTYEMILSLPKETEEEKLPTYDDLYEETTYL